MLNEKRIKLMTRMASYEDGEGRKSRSVASHFRSDYVALQVLKAVICATIASMIVFGVYVYYNFEELMLDIYKIDVFELAAGILKKYVIFTVAYCVIVYIAFSIRYSRARHSLKIYFNNLKYLGNLYKEETDDIEEVR